jgi:hypothetical protein
MKDVGFQGWIGFALVIFVVMAVAFRIDFLRELILPNSVVKAATA